MATTPPPQMATCTTQQWTFNSRAQSPCVVGSALAGVCSGGQFTLVDLEPGFLYLGPTASAATPCRCSTVYYQMLSACALCQGETWLRWGAYSANCGTVYSGVFPRPLPAGIAVPAWAYLNIEAEDNFNATAARALAASGQESTGASTPTSTQITTIGGSSSGNGSQAPSTTGSGTPQQSNDPGQKSKSNTGAIAGGVVGGILGLALIGALVFFFLRRRSKTNVAPSAAYVQAPLENPASPPTSPPPPMSYADGSSNYHHTGNSGGHGGGQPQIYNPENPTTFPPNDPPQMSYGPTGGSGSLYPHGGQPNYGQNYSGGPGSTGYIPPTFTGHSASSGGYTNPNTSMTANSNAGMQYTGVPEI